MNVFCLFFLTGFAEFFFRLGFKDVAFKYFRYSKSC